MTDVAGRRMVAEIDGGFGLGRAGWLVPMSQSMRARSRLRAPVA